jgi:hypothetical protein
MKNLHGHIFASGLFGSKFGNMVCLCVGGEGSNSVPSRRKKRQEKMAIAGVTYRIQALAMGRRLDSA